VESNRQIVADAFAARFSADRPSRPVRTACYDSIAFNELWATVSPGDMEDVVRPPGQDGG
jgi:hypothetical protein